MNGIGIAKTYNGRKNLAHYRVDTLQLDPESSRKHLAQLGPRFHRFIVGVMFFVKQMYCLAIIVKGAEVDILGGWFGQ
jgi:hypothetical protein